MLARWSAVLGILCFSVCAEAQTRTLAVYPGEVRTLDSIAAHALEVELQRVLAPAGIEIAMQRPGPPSTGNDEFQLLVVGSFQGDCSVETLPLIRNVSLRNRPLADTSVSHGHVLPYFRVDCQRIVETLTPSLQRLSVPLRQAILGRALARVIAHEIYHIMAQTTDHEESGIARTALSLQNLTAAIFDFNAASLRRMQPSSSPSAPPIPQGALAAVIRH